MVTPLQIHTFGGVAIRLQGNARQFDARSAEALLVYLACHARPLGREVLAEFFWPDRTAEQARTNLRVALHRLRQQLAPYLLISRQTVAFQPGLAPQVDCLDFESHLAAGRLAEATALYSGDFLNDFYLDGSPAFEQWALLERERLRTLAIAAFQQLISRQSAAGQLASAITSAHRLLQLDALHEPTHRQLIRLLAQAGQRSAALVQYETCRQLLQRELGAVPDAATTALVEQIRTGELGITDYELRNHEEDRPSFVTHHAKIVTLPPQPTPFIGREAELAQIATLLANPDCRLLSLLGAGGMGKTRLALAAAARQVDHFAEGVCFVPLVAVAAPEFLFAAIRESLHLPSGHEPAETQVTAYLQGRQLLLILDNFEHLLLMADTVARLLRQAPQIKVLVTTRTRLQIVEEWLLPVTGLAGGDDPASSAAQLFIRSAQRVQPDFDTTGQAAAIADICQRVEGMPLAIELAAGWVRLMSCGEIALRLAHSFDLLNSTTSNRPERHRSIRALFDQSWRLLSGLEQQLLMHLSIFRGGWQLEEAAVVLDELLSTPPGAGVAPQPLLNLLLALVDQSLVQRAGHQRFTLHELIRQYAFEHFGAGAAVEAVRRRHFDAYLALARRADAHLRGPDAHHWFQRLDAELDNLRAALQWAIACGHVREVAWLGVALVWFWQRRGHVRETIQWLAPLLPQRQRLAPALRLAYLQVIFMAWAVLGEFPKALQQQQELTELAQACENPKLQATTLLALAIAIPDFTAATVAFDKTIALARQLQAAQADVPETPDEFCLLGNDIPHLLANALHWYGELRLGRGDYAGVTALCRESLAILRGMGNCDTIAYPLGNLGRLALIDGEVDQAHSLIGEAVSLSRTIGNHFGLAYWLPWLGRTHHYLGQVESAWQRLTEARHLAQTIAYYPILPNMETGLAAIALQRHDLLLAQQMLAAAFVGLSKARWVTGDLVEALLTLMRLTAAKQQFTQAATLWGLAARLQGEIHHRLDAPLRPVVDAAQATVRAALAPVAFAEAFAFGEQMTLDEAFATLLLR